MVSADRNFWTISKKVKNFSQKKSKFRLEFQQKVSLFVNEKELRNPHSFFLLFHQCSIKLKEKKIVISNRKILETLFFTLLKNALPPYADCPVNRYGD